MTRAPHACDRLPLRATAALNPLFVFGWRSRDSPVSNIVSSIEQLDVDGDGKFTWQEFRHMHEVFPQILFPCFRLQISICRNVLGVQWCAELANSQTSTARWLRARLCCAMGLQCGAASLLSSML